MSLLVVFHDVPVSLCSVTIADDRHDQQGLQRSYLKSKKCLEKDTLYLDVDNVLYLLSSLCSAIRHDRTRGGRSSYGGSSPFEEPKKKRPIKIIQPRRPSNPPSGESTLVSVLSGNSQNNDGPFVPQILTDIMNLESLMCDDDIPANISVDDFSLSNPNVFMTLLQLCELKLYKIVRWARNLPYFANISVSVFF